MAMRRSEILVVGLAILLGFAGASFETLFGASPPSGAAGQTASASKVSENYLGCYLDKQDRDLSGAEGSAANNAACQAFCSERGFRFAATEAGGQCFCGNSYGKYGKLPESRCNMVCSGNPSEKCGGWWAPACTWWGYGGWRWREPRGGYPWEGS